MTLCFALACKQSSDDEDPAGKARSRHITVNKADLANSIEVLESFKLARESWELLYSLESLDKGNAAAEPLHGIAAHRSHRAVGTIEPQSLGSLKWNLLWVLTVFDLALVAIVATLNVFFRNVYSLFTHLWLFSGHFSWEQLSLRLVLIILGEDVLLMAALGQA